MRDLDKNKNATNFLKEKKKKNRSRPRAAAARSFWGNYLLVSETPLPVVWETIT